MNLGLAFATKDLPMGALPELAAAADDAGFARFCVMEAFRETVVPSTLCATATQRIGVGTGVTQIFPANPVTLALQAAELQEVSAGRFSIGLGLGASFVVPRWFGVPYEKPMTRMREFVQIIRGVHESAGAAPFSFDGALFSIRKYALGDRPLTPVPIEVAAIGPQMQELAGELADGVHVGAVHSPGYIEQVRERLATGAARSGRDADAVQITYHLVCGCDPDAETGRSLARRSLVYLTQYPHYFKRFEEEGFGPLAEEIGALVRGHEMDAAAAKVSPAMLERFALAGTPEECRQQLAAHAGRAATPLITLFPFRMSEQHALDALRLAVDALAPAQ